MGRTLTEEQKAERAAQRIEKKDAAELGPLFADQVEEVDRAALLISRRLGWAKLREQSAERLGTQEVCGALTERSLRERAQALVSPGLFAQLLAYRDRVYPPIPDYGMPFWKGVLTGKRVVFSWRRVEDLTLKGGIRLVEDGVFPPEGWIPPHTAEELKHQYWQKCKLCGMYHAPGQVACYDSGEKRTDISVIPAPKEQP